MSKVSLEQVKQLPHSKLLKAIDRVKKRLKQNQVVKDMFKEFEVELDEIDLIPMCFDDLDVSARTEHGIIYLNYSLLSDGDFDKDDHYIVHELTHYLQQTTGDKPTKGSTDDDYLDNEFEQEGFQNQTEYLSETRSDDAAENYADKVLDHHDVPADERKERKQQLLNLASRLKQPQQLKLDLFEKKEKPGKLHKTKEEMMQDLEEALVRGPQESHARPAIEKIHPLLQKDRLRRLKEILEVLNKDASAYFWDESGKNNLESPADRSYVNPQQTRLKFRDLKNKIDVFAKKFNQLSPEEIKKLQRLKLGGGSDVTSFFKSLESKGLNYKPLEMPLAIVAKDLDNNNYVGWILVRPHGSSLEIDTFVDKAYRGEGVGTKLMEKFKEIQANLYPDTEVEAGPWSPTASAFYQKTDILEDPYQRDINEEEELPKPEVPQEQQKLPFKDY